MEGVHLDSFVIIIFGASGSGKTSLMEMLMVSGGQYSVHEKSSDRPPRQYDDVELRCVTNFNVNDYDYVYETYGFRYGIQRKQIDKALEEIKHHFIICNDIATIKKIKRDYGDVVKTIFMFFDAPNDVLLDIQRKRKISDDEIETRLAKTSALCRQYAENMDLFDEILPNYFNEDQEKLKLRLEELLIGFSRQQNHCDNRKKASNEKPPTGAEHAPASLDS